MEPVAFILLWMTEFAIEYFYANYSLRYSLKKIKKIKLNTKGFLHLLSRNRSHREDATGLK